MFLEFLINQRWKSVIFTLRGDKTHKIKTNIKKYSAGGIDKKLTNVYNTHSS